MTRPSFHPEATIVVPARLVPDLLPLLRSLIRERATAGGGVDHTLVELVDVCERAVAASVVASVGSGSSGTSTTDGHRSAHAGTQEVAAVLGVSGRRVRQLCSAGLLPAFQDPMTREWRIDVDLLR